MTRKIIICLLVAIVLWVSHLATFRVAYEAGLKDRDFDIVMTVAQTALICAQIAIITISVIFSLGAVLGLMFALIGLWKKPGRLINGWLPCLWG